MWQKNLNNKKKLSKFSNQTSKLQRSKQWLKRKPQTKISAQRTLWLQKSDLMLRWWLTLQIVKKPTIQLARKKAIKKRLLTGREASLISKGLRWWSHFLHRKKIKFPSKRRQKSLQSQQK